MLKILTASLLALATSLPAHAEDIDHEVRGISLGMTREQAFDALSHFRFLCEPAIKEGYRRHLGTQCRYRENHFSLYITLRPDDDRVYRVEIEDKYPDGFDRRTVDAEFKALYGEPDIEERNAMFSGSFLRVWEPDLTVRLEDYEQDTIRVILADPAVDHDLQHQWYKTYPRE